MEANHELLSFPDMAMHVFWGNAEERVRNREPGKAIGQLVYSKDSIHNLSLRMDFKLGKYTRISVSYLNVVVHNPQTAITFSPEEWYLIGQDLNKIKKLAKDKKLAKLKNKLDYSVVAGEAIFAPSAKPGVWIGKGGFALFLGKEDLKIFTELHTTIKRLAVMQRKYKLS